MAGSTDMSSLGDLRDRKVSVVITCYKYAHFLKQALDSVLSQTHSNVEAIVINDGSPDNTDEVMLPYAGDPRVVYIKQDNAGQAVAKNRGIQASTGDFVAFLDADDAWEPNKLELQLPLFSQPEVGVTFTMMDFMDEDGRRMPYTVTDLSRPRRGNVSRELFVDNFVPFSASMVRKECFARAGMMDTSLRMAIDWDLWLRMSVHYSFDFVDQPLLLYRTGHAGQMSRNYFVRAKDQMTIMTRFVSQNPGLIPAGLLRWTMAYSYCNRGFHARSTSGMDSCRYYLNALWWRWYHWPAYKGLAKLLVYKSLETTGLLGLVRRSGQS